MALQMKSKDIFKFSGFRCVPLKLRGDMKADDESPPPVQQDNLLRKFLLDCVYNGIPGTYLEYGDSPPDFGYKPHKPLLDQAPPGRPEHMDIGHVIVVGAGPSGLAAARELARTSFKVTILESSGRVGGRCFTIGGKFGKQPDGRAWSDPALHVEGGAMRLPGPPPNSDTTRDELRQHFLTDYYNVALNVKQVPFLNHDGNTLRYIYGHRILSSDWNADPKKYCDKYWPKWNFFLKNKKAWLQHQKKPGSKSAGVSDLYNAYMSPVISEIEHAANGRDAEDAWYKWAEKWSKITAREYLIHYESWSKDFDAPYNTLPNWPTKTVAAYVKASYGKLIDQSLAVILRDDLGQWWKDPMHTPKDGMQSTPEAIKESCETHGVRIRYNTEVSSITDLGCKGVQVYVRGQSRPFFGDRVIITTPLTILRQIEIDPPLPYETQTAISQINYVPSTKVCLEYSRRFWELDDGISGGTSISTEVCGQIVYPTKAANVDPETEGGILVSYTWNQDAAILGGGSDVGRASDVIVTNVQECIEKMHNLQPGEYYTGNSFVQAWFNDPDNAGAFVMYTAGQYNEFFDEILDSYDNIHIAGEAGSWTNGWIQGAAESGVRAAYQIFEGFMSSTARKGETDREAINRVTRASHIIATRND